MDAPLIRLALILTALSSAGATYTTPNFIVKAPTPEFAKHVGDLAEHFRDEIAMQWLGKKLPKWYKPCPIDVQVGEMGAGGATSFAFDRDRNGEMHVFGWRMNVQGPPERILDSVLPHEVSHTIFASHFRRPLPRWADEGAATLVEHESEQRRQVLLLNQVMKSGRHIPLRKLLAIKEYPRDMHDVMVLYAEGYSLADFLVQAGGRGRYLQFLEDAHRHGWDRAIATHYTLNNVESLEERWSGWVMAGSPRFNLPEGHQLAGAENRGVQPVSQQQVVVRGQNDDEPVFVADQRGSGGFAPQGSQLAAPDPRRNQTAGTVHAGEPAGGRIPLPLGNGANVNQGQPIPNDGWQPVAPEHRRPRPEPLAARPTERADFTRDDEPAFVGEQKPAVIPSSWSEFPQARSGGQPAAYDNVPAGGFSR